MATVAIHPPKTPVTKGSHTVAKATIPNVCKMPGPPAPFIPSPLPNIAKSELSPKDYSTTVKIEGNAVAIRGATFESIGDMASKGTGGGLISANCHGPAKFITPGSLTVKIEGKSVHLLGEPMLNNCGASGSPPNTGATMMGGPGADHSDLALKQQPLEINCDDKKNDSRPGKAWDPCMVEQLCAMVKAYNESPRPKESVTPSPSHPAPYHGLSGAEAAAQNVAFGKYKEGIKKFASDFTDLVKAKGKDHPDVVKQFHSECQHKKWSDPPPSGSGGKVPVARSGPGAMNPDHVHPAGLGGSLQGPFKWSDARVNQTVGPAMDSHKPKDYPGGIKADPSCKCDT